MLGKRKRSSALLEENALPPVAVLKTRDCSEQDEDKRTQKFTESGMKSKTVTKIWINKRLPLGLPLF